MRTPYRQLVLKGCSSMNESFVSDLDLHVYAMTLAFMWLTSDHNVHKSGLYKNMCELYVTMTTQQTEQRCHNVVKRLTLCCLYVNLWTLYTSDFYIVHVMLPQHCHNVVCDVVYRFNIVGRLDDNLGVHGFKARVQGNFRLQFFNCDNVLRFLVLLTRSIITSGSNS